MAPAASKSAYLDFSQDQVTNGTGSVQYGVDLSEHGKHLHARHGYSVAERTEKRSRKPATTPTELIYITCIIGS